ncbi:MAG: hypothetical protein EAY75_14615 [Bacteroidetes bacterium]|nr:MAG: hypothetical protein EAY75_14615 [Bacteroidota bacterium]
MWAKNICEGRKRSAAGVLHHGLRHAAVPAVWVLKWKWQWWLAQRVALGKPAGAWPGYALRPKGSRIERKARTRPAQRAGRTCSDSRNRGPIWLQRPIAPKKISR